jgi:hypothetical protein
LFTADAAVYVLVIGTFSGYGWMMPGETSPGDWIPRKSLATSGPASFSLLLPRIRQVVEESNSALRSMYARFSSDTGNLRRPPQVIIEKFRDSIKCHIWPPERMPDFRESMHALARQLGTALTGAGVLLAESESAITIARP